MKESELLDRKHHYCKHCKRSFSLRELNISSVEYPTHERGTMILWVSCPNCHHRIRRIGTNHKRVKNVLENYIKENIRVKLI